MAATMFFLDFETSGLDAKRHGIIQAAWIVEQDGKVLSERRMDVALRYGCDVDLQALEVTGFTLDRIRNGKPLEYMMAALRADLAPGTVCRVIPCGHNVSFDLDFLRAACNFTRDPVDRYVDFSAMIDTLAMARWLRHTERYHFPDCKLETVCKILRIPLEAHDALSDVKATREVYHLFKSHLVQLPKYS